MLPEDKKVIEGLLDHCRRTAVAATVTKGAELEKIFTDYAAALTRVLEEAERVTTKINWRRMDREQELAVGESFLVGMGFYYDQSRDNLGVSFSVEPRILAGQLGRVGGVPIPPAGVDGIE